MAEETLQAARSEPFRKAWALNSTKADPFVSLDATGTMPVLDGQTATTALGTETFYGVHKIGHEGVYAPAAAVLVPYCSGGPGISFSVRLWAWRQTVTSSRAYPLWIPLILVELLCVSCNRRGPSSLNNDPVNRYSMTDQENFCDTISVTSGSLGPDGWINAPGSDITASACLDLQGCQLLQFEFLSQDTATSMNCWWTKL